MSSQRKTAVVTGALLITRLALHGPLAVALANHLQTRPILLAADSARLNDHLIDTLLLAAVPVFLCLILFIAHIETIVVVGLHETGDNIILQVLLVVLDFSRLMVPVG